MIAKRNDDEFGICRFYSWIKVLIRQEFGAFWSTMISLGC
jgi:hypothetical protein